MFLEKDAFKEICSSREKPVSCGIMYRKKELLACGIYNPTLDIERKKSLDKEWDLNIKLAMLIFLILVQTHKK